MLVKIGESDKQEHRESLHSGDKEKLKARLSKLVFIDGKWVLPLIQGGKGVGATNGSTAGAWARENAGGTIAATGASGSIDMTSLDNDYPFNDPTRHGRHAEMIDISIKGCIFQVKRAHELANGKGLVRINFLKMAGGSMEIMRGVLKGTKVEGGANLINAVTMGAGLPAEEDAQICADEKVFLDPIISSSMALKVLLKRTYRKWAGRYHEVIGAVVYEDPWLAGGHNGITSRENPDEPIAPYERIKELRAIMNEHGMHDVAIIMAGGVWYLRDWADWLDDPEIAPIAFQIGTRDLLTQECPISDEWKHLLLTMKKGDVALNKFSPTGFYSSAYKNSMIMELYAQSERQIAYKPAPDDEKTEAIKALGVPPKGFWVTPEDNLKADMWIAQGYNTVLKTPDETVIFVTPEKAVANKADKTDCVGCLVTCKLSSWSQNPDTKYSTKRLPDPRTHCIRKSLQGAIEGKNLDEVLIFSGHNAFKSGDDPFYRNKNGEVVFPTVKQLVARLLTGD